MMDEQIAPYFEIAGDMDFAIGIDAQRIGEEHQVRGLERKDRARGAGAGDFAAQCFVISLE